MPPASGLGAGDRKGSCSEGQDRSGILVLVLLLSGSAAAIGAPPAQALSSTPDHIKTRVQGKMFAQVHDGNLMYLAGRFPGSSIRTATGIRPGASPPSTWPPAIGTHRSSPWSPATSTESLRPRPLAGRHDTVRRRGLRLDQRHQREEPRRDRPRHGAGRRGVRPEPRAATWTRSSAAGPPLHGRLVLPRGRQAAPSPGRGLVRRDAQQGVAPVHGRGRLSAAVPRPLALQQRRERERPVARVLAGPQPDLHRRVVLLRQRRAAELSLARQRDKRKSGRVARAVRGHRRRPAGQEPGAEQCVGDGGDRHAACTSGSGASRTTCRHSLSTTGSVGKTIWKDCGSPATSSRWPCLPTGRGYSPAAISARRGSTSSSTSAAARGSTA